MHCQFGENIYFCTPFREEKGGEQDAKTVLSHVAGITQLVE